MVFCLYTDGTMEETKIEVNEAFYVAVKCPLELEWTTFLGRRFSLLVELLTSDLEIRKQEPASGLDISRHNEACYKRVG